MGRICVRRLVPHGVRATLRKQLRAEFTHDLMPMQMRNLQTQISRDADIVVAAMVSIVGSTLIFQGWRLDPLLLLCQVSTNRCTPMSRLHESKTTLPWLPPSQALTTSVAFWYGLEAFRLRAKTDLNEVRR